MNRRIKLRFWSKEENKFSDSQLLVLTRGGRVISSFNGVDFSDDYEISQFTGLLDKNGKEIYEGDVVRYDECSCGDCDRRNQIGQIVFDEGGFDIHNLNGEYEQDLCACTMNECIEVIGNVFENPILLKGEK